MDNTKPTLPNEQKPELENPAETHEDPQPKQPTDEEFGLSKPAQCNLDGEEACESCQ